MIKQAKSLQEINDCIDLLQCFLKNTVYKQSISASANREHLGRLVKAVNTSGDIWIAYKDKIPAGLLLAVIEPNMWAPKISHYRELVWFVKEEYRSTPIGGRLFLTYCRRAEELMSKGVIQGYFTTQMTTTSPIDLESRGFRSVERTYLKEH
jgi:hypothetical protein